ncbi:MAG: amidohydrolase family protein, partial [Deltaproteobacteria bacterium]|nr:amidohydrolase family protein [Deltaproteobacteria bacterium]
MLQGKVVDGDGHIIEPPQLWHQYLEAQYKDRAIRMEKDQAGVEYLVIDGQPSARLRGMGPALGGNGRDYEKLCKTGNFGYFDGPQGAYEPHARLRHLDNQGIDAAVLFPSLGLAWESEVKDAKLAAAYARAYNNWILDFTSVDRQRLIPMAIITLQDIDEGIKEVRRVARLGAKGAFMRAAPINQMPWWDRVYDPFWAVLEETGLPIGMHVATNDYFLGHQWKMAESVMTINSALHFY